MPPLPPKNSVIRRKPFYKPPKPGSVDAVKGYPTINPFPLLEDKKSVNKSNKNKQRSLNTDMSRLARKNYRKKNKKKKNTKKVVKAKPAGPNPQGERVEVRLVSSSLKKRKSKKRKYKQKKSKRRKSKRRN